MLCAAWARRYDHTTIRNGSAVIGGFESGDADNLGLSKVLRPHSAHQPYLCISCHFRSFCAPHIPARSACRCACPPMNARRCAHTSSTGDRESSVTAQGYPRRLRSTRHCTRRGWSRAGAAQFASAECRGARAPSACRSYGRSRVQKRTHRMKHRLYPITTLVASIHFADVLGSRALRGDTLD